MSLSNVMLHETERRMAGRYVERHGIVTSYDPKTYLAKVTFQPEGQESGWLPIETGHVGDNFGFAIGLTPGDGKKTGDQVIVRYQEGDIESGKVVQRVHSDQDKPPHVESGEAVFWTRFKKSGTGQGGLGDDTTESQSGGDVLEEGAQAGTGQQIFFKKDGSITWTDGNGATQVFDGKGNCVLTCNDMTHNVNGNRVVNIKGADTETIGGDKTEAFGGAKNETVAGDISKTTGGKRIDSYAGLWQANAKAGNWFWLMDDDG